MIGLNRWMSSLTPAALILMILILLGSGQAAGVEGPPDSLPEDCDDFVPVPNACMRGYIYAGDMPVAGADVLVESAYGQAYLTTGSGPLSTAPYYSVNLSDAPLSTLPGDVITITASHGGMIRARAWTVQSGGQQVDVGVGPLYTDTNVIPFGSVSDRTSGLDFGDGDLDGDLDLAVGNHGQNRICWNNGDHTFNCEDAFGAGTTFDVDWGDLNQDDHPDVVVANSHGQSNLVCINNRDHSFVCDSFSLCQDPAGSDEVCHAALGDVDNDDNLDVALAKHFPDHPGTDDVIYYNDGTGAFPTTHAACYDNATLDLGFGHLDSNQYLDLAVVGHSPDYICINDGTGRFVEPRWLAFRVDAGTWRVALADAEGDGDLDIVAGEEYDYPIEIYENDGLGSFTRKLSLGPAADRTQGLAWRDVDNNGYPDILAGNLGGQDKIYFNDPVATTGEITFTRILSVGPPTSPTKELALGDIDGDGDLDLAVGYDGLQDLIYVNGNWVAPGAAFTASPLSGFVPLTVQFTDQSTHTIVAWTWDLGDGSVSGARHPSHTYESSGRYAVSLVASAPDGSDSEIKVNYLFAFASEVYLPLVMEEYNTWEPPAAPILDPIDKIAGGGNYTVTWSSSAGASSYLLQEDDSGSFSNPATAYAGPEASASITGRPIGTYYYRVNASNIHGTSGWSNTQFVTVRPAPDPPVLDPIDNSDGDGNYAVSWSTVLDASIYVLQEDDNDSFSSPTIVYAGPEAFTSITGQPTGTYYYRVNASSVHGTGDWSNTQSVIVRPALEPPVLDPIDNGDRDGNYAVSWSASPDASNYVLQEDDNDSFSSPATVYAGSATSTSITGQPTGTYYYRGNASNASGVSDWSNIQAVMVGPVPDPPVLNPISNPDGDGNYTVSWSTAARADSYTLQEDDNAAFSSPTTAYSGPSTSKAVTGKATGTYYYRVNASNAYGTSAWSNTRSVQVSGWITIKSETFEDTFPGEWQVADADPTGGQYYWGKRTCRPHQGSYSGWAVGGGDGAGLPCGSDYPTYVIAWMVYGPFSLADASDADLTFQAWLDTELNYDVVFRGASINGTNYYGYFTSGNTGGWISRQLDLTAVPTLGDLTGYSSVWIALAFVSDLSDTLPEGAYVDNILLRKYVGPTSVLIEEGVPPLPSTAHEEEAAFTLEP